MPETGPQVMQWYERVRIRQSFYIPLLDTNAAQQVYWSQINSVSSTTELDTCNTHGRQAQETVHLITLKLISHNGCI